ncbi:MAG: class I tRNA ligase family protein, partial [Nanoarchaeota archaeon]|nr:class I tRNA ligase family protein [Nanoarchaeota archaeon]
YIISKFVNNGTLKVKELTEDFFDYVFLGKGDAKKSWKEIKEEFDYFYPLDLNLGGKEHQTVHFPVFVMNHVAILPPQKWPKGIFVNWWVIGKGSKISKSKGGAEPIPAAIKKYGVDAMRLYYAHIGSPHVDVVWAEDVVFNYKNTVERIAALVTSLTKLNGKAQPIDHWLISKTQQNLHLVNDAMAQYNLRDVASIVYFTMYDNLRWYLRRGGEHKKTITEVVQLWCRLMNPITPHLSEELNPAKGLVSASSWPVMNEEKVNLKAEAAEELVKDILEGMRNVVKLAQLEKMKTVTLFIAENWTYSVYSTIAHEIKVTHNMGEIMRNVLEDDSLKVKGKEITRIVTSLLKDATKIPALITSQEEELVVVQGAKSFLQQEFGCTIKIVLAEDSDHPKAKAAMPGKVGILAE